MTKCATILPKITASTTISFWQTVIISFLRTRITTCCFRLSRVSAKLWRPRSLFLSSFYKPRHSSCRKSVSAFAERYIFRDQVSRILAYSCIVAGLLLIALHCFDLITVFKKHSCSRELPHFCQPPNEVCCERSRGSATGLMTLWISVLWTSLQWI